MTARSKAKPKTIPGYGMVAYNYKRRVNNIREDYLFFPEKLAGFNRAST